ncbi:MAG: VCBS repeat-containing protein [Pyrinomonadaceae bacterium]
MNNKKLISSWVLIAASALLAVVFSFPIDQSAAANAEASISNVAALSPCLKPNGSIQFFPPNNPWNADVSNFPVHSNSNNFVNSIGATKSFHPDFGTVYNGAPWGIPYVIVPGNQAQINVSVRDYPDESDFGTAPIPPNAPVEGGLGSNGDRHVLVVDKDNCKLYELFSAYPENNNGWNAAGTAKFDLTSNAMRPLGWTSADAAGLPILPGLALYDEVAAGEITHALRFTVNLSQRAYIYPARHFASSSTDPNRPPMGLRFRLKSSVDISGFPQQAQVILRALKKYGMMVADNGGDWFISGAPDPRWNDAQIDTLKRIRGSDFEAVNTSSLPTLAVRKQFDYDGDGRADVSVFRPGSGNWYWLNSSTNGFVAANFGLNGDKIAPGDFDNDGKTDLCVFRPSNGVWYRLNSFDNTFAAVQFGTNGDIPVAGDFDGDGRSDIAVFRPGNGYWYRINSSNNQFVAQQFGTSGDKPQVGDFDADGKNDVAVFRPSSGFWYFIGSANGSLSGTQFGMSGDVPTPADFDGDRKADIAVFRPTNGTWYRLNSSNGAFIGQQWGLSGDIPTPADYDGDAKADIAVFRPASGTWFMLRSTAGYTAQQFGASGDVPTPAAFGQ